MWMPHIPQLASDLGVCTNCSFEYDITWNNSFIRNEYENQINLKIQSNKRLICLLTKVACADWLNFFITIKNMWVGTWISLTGSNVLLC